MEKKDNQIVIDVKNSDFGLILNCAVRYAIGRRTYVPSSIIGFITPMLPQLDNRTIHCFDQDIVDAKYTSGYGDDCDKRDWMRFHEAVKSEKIKRGQELYVHWREKEEKSWITNTHITPSVAPGEWVYETGHHSYQDTSMSSGDSISPMFRSTNEDDVSEYANNHKVCNYIRRFHVDDNGYFSDMEWFNHFTKKWMS